MAGPMSQSVENLRAFCETWGTRGRGELETSPFSIPTGRHSGIEQGMRYAYLWTFRKAKVIHFVSFRDPAEALEAAGLGE